MTNYYDSSNMSWFFPNKSTFFINYSSFIQIMKTLFIFEKFNFNPSSRFTLSFNELISSSNLSFLLSNSQYLWGESFVFSFFPFLFFLLFPWSSVWALLFSSIHVSCWNYYFLHEMKLVFLNCWTNFGNSFISRIFFSITFFSLFFNAS